VLPDNTTGTYMNTRILVIVGVAIAAALGWVAYNLYNDKLPFGDATYTIERTDYNPPKQDPQDVLEDDSLLDKKPVAFDPALVDRRPLGEKNEWLVNASAAVIALDVPMIKADHDPHLLALHSSYAAAVKTAPTHMTVLPSVNVIDGKAKQFDDGLY